MLCIFYQNTKKRWGKSYATFCNKRKLKNTHVSALLNKNKQVKDKSENCEDYL